MGWKDLFSWDKKDWLWVVFIVLVVFVAWSYKSDIDSCKGVALDPCGVCDLLRYDVNVSGVGVGFEGVDVGDYGGGDSKLLSVG